jgi:CHASE2 domain-containing sensor protein
LPAHNQAFRSAPVFIHRQVVKIASVKIVFAKPALVGAALTVLCGLLLLTPLGDAWENASYDLLYRFGARAATNQIVLIRMDNESYKILGQNRDALWDRTLHTELLRKLTDDGTRLVVFDILFQDTNNPGTDAKLAEAIRQNGKVVLTAFVKDESDPKLDSVSIDQPQKLFLDAAAGCGVGKSDALTGQLARRHWPFFAPGEGDIHSLGWAAAQAFGAHLDASVEKQWLRYYGKNGPGTNALSYYLALTQKPGFFRDKIVFIGGWPEDPRNLSSKEKDAFLTPYTQQTGNAVGGVEIMATTFLNLVNGDWLRRLPAWIEALLLTLTGILIGCGLCQLKPLPSLLVAAGIFLTVMLAFVSWSYFSNYWFPWLVVAGGQVPCALAWAWVSQTRQVTVFHERYPGYAPVGEPFGEGAYGKVWLVRDATGQLQALKEIKRSKFEYEGPYEREFRGIKSYKPVSNQHPGLLHIDHVNCNEPQGYFYYVMELGDAFEPDWEQKGDAYKPRDLDSVCRQAEGWRLPARECIRIGIVLLDALDFLHQQGLVHRDIKPSNIIFVNGRPKLADVGLVRDANPDGTIVGTEDYMPPRPEPTGTRLADIYALGKVLYVISTGKHASSFAELSTTLVEKPEFMRLNEIICKACQPAVDQRYTGAFEMLAALREAQVEIDAGHTRRM